MSFKSSLSSVLPGWTVMIVLLLLPVAQANAQSKIEAPKTKLESAQLGKTRNVHRLGNLYFAGQFEQDDLAVIKKSNIERIISLRTKSELEWDEEALVTDAGIAFLAFPYKSPEALTDELFDNARKALADDSKTTLLHCRSASRVGGVWLTYRVLDQGVDVETALAEAKTIGLKTPFIQEKALAYIKKKQSAPKTTASPNPASVKPGINKNFLDPNLDVDSFVKRFEIESREVYLQREMILKTSGIKAGEIVADVGAGTGLFTRMFSKTVGDQGWVYAVDISPRFLEHINSESAKQKLENITGVLCASDSVNLPPNSVDVVFVCDTYHHFEYPKSTLQSMHRALKKNGRLILIDFERIPGKSREWLLGHVRAGKEVFRAEVQDAGFSLVEEAKLEGFKENYFLIFRKDAK